MAKAAEGGRKRRAGEPRFQQAFVADAARLLHTLAADLDADAEVNEPAAIELRRLAEMAETLDLPAIARAALEASQELEQGAMGPRSLRKVANALRHSTGRLRFGPIVLVGLPADEERELAAAAATCCEPLRFYPDVTAFAGALHTEQPAAVVLPVAAVDAVTQLIGKERFPVLVHASAHVFESRLAAARAGAHAVLTRPLSLRDVTRLVRWRADGALEPAEVLVLADPDGSRDAIVAALGALGLEVRLATDPAELTDLLDRTRPSAAVIGARVAGREALPLAELVRCHPRCGSIPILVAGRPEDPASLRAAGVDDVMRVDAHPALAAQRTKDRILRMQALPWVRDPYTGWLNRLGVLDGLDDALAASSRTGRALSVVLLEVDAIGRLEEAGRRGAAADLCAMLRGVVFDTFRRTDVIGTIGVPWSVLVALPDCERDQAELRVAEVLERFAQRVEGDVRFESVQLAFGLADTHAGTSTVAVRAEQDLR